MSKLSNYIKRHYLTGHKQPVPKYKNLRIFDEVPPPIKKRHFSAFIPWMFSFAFILIVAGVVLYLFAPGQGILLSALTPKPERFTELYFEDHLDLPKKILPGIPATVSATINNLEGETVTYAVEVVAHMQADPSTKVQLRNEEVEVSMNEKKTFPVELTLPDTLQGKVKVIILLKNIDQSIHFWTDLPIPYIPPTPGATSSAQPASTKTPSILIPLD